MEVPSVHLEVHFFVETLLSDLFEGVVPLASAEEPIIPHGHHDLDVVETMYLATREVAEHVIGKALQDVCPGIDLSAVHDEGEEAQDVPSEERDAEPAEHEEDLEPERPADEGVEHVREHGVSVCGGRGNSSPI
ncbi:MAG: hypothetical protein AB200_00405 [Parcubacteria bacterium C7867-005]|nr:MAG: hypothetical protein AB200_00405 [Parcubacteria bacterium C7867-005]